jgi:Family of unknown function (DUF6491)
MEGRRNGGRILNKTTTVSTWVVGAILSMLACAASAVDPTTAPVPEAQIPFAKNAIWSWQVVDDKTVLIQTNSREWYKATLFGVCFNLSFANIVGFKANANGNFDKFSSIQLRDQTCPLASLVKTTAPPTKTKDPTPPAATPAHPP